MKYIEILRDVKTVTNCFDHPCLATGLRESNRSEKGRRGSPITGSAPMESMESVILVPGVRRMDLADFDGVMIQEPALESLNDLNDRDIRDIT